MTDDLMTNYSMTILLSLCALLRCISFVVSALTNFAYSADNFAIF